MKLLTAALFALISIAPAAQAADRTAQWDVCFRPGPQSCTDVAIREISAAKHSILMQAYSFTSVPIAKALVDAHKRGIDVRAILDKSQRTERYSSATFLANSGIPTLIDDCCAIAHNKVMVIDGATVITGSFNFTKAAEEKNAENLIVLRDPALAKLYADNWLTHTRSSTPFQPKY